MEDIKAGDVILLWNMPYPLGTFLIYLFTGVNCDHCAMVLPRSKDDPETYVYEATLWKVRKLSAPDYWYQIEKWAQSKKIWRKLTGKKLKVEIWSSPTELNILEMLSEAEDWVGTPYSMIFNYLFKGPEVHCSEYVSRILSKDTFEWEKEPSRVTPIDVRCMLELAKWSKRTYELEY